MQTGSSARSSVERRQPSSKRLDGDRDSQEQLSKESYAPRMTPRLLSPSNHSLACWRRTTPLRAAFENSTRGPSADDPTCTWRAFARRAVRLTQSGFVNFGVKSFCAGNDGSAVIRALVHIFWYKSHEDPSFTLT